MDTPASVEQDLHFIRTAVEARARKPYGPAAIAYIWAITIAIGYALMDLPGPRWRQPGGPDFTIWVSLYWLIATPVAVIASCWVGARAARAQGVAEPGEGFRHGWHWGSFGFLIPAAGLIAYQLGVNARGQTQLIALVTGVIYFLGGVHLDRRFFFPGLVFIVGSVAMGFVPRFGGTLVGVSVALSLIAGALWMKPRHDPRPVTN